MKSAALAVSVALATTLCAALSAPSATASPYDGINLDKCWPVFENWDTANKSGAPGRRKALKVVLTDAKADPEIGDCFSRKIHKDLGERAKKTSAMDGWHTLLNTNTDNFDAAKDQSPDNRCTASKLIIAGWNAFYAERKDVNAIVNESAQNKHKALCND